MELRMKSTTGKLFILAGSVCLLLGIISFVKGGSIIPILPGLLAIVVGINMARAKPLAKVEADKVVLYALIGPAKKEIPIHSTEQLKLEGQWLLLKGENKSKKLVKLSMVHPDDLAQLKNIIATV
jgi:hypothetical protein